MPSLALAKPPLVLNHHSGNETFTKEVRQNCLNLTDLLRLNPSVKLPCARALEIFSPLVSRFYSICTCVPDLIAPDCLSNAE